MVMAVSVVASSIISTAQAHAATSTPPDPTANLALSGAFRHYCIGFVSGANDGACDRAALAQINAGNQEMHVGTLKLPSDYSILSVELRFMDVVNGERKLYHLQSLTTLSPYNDMAAAGAARFADPTGPAGTRSWSVWGVGFITPLAQLTEWLYDDGPGSENMGCTKAGQSGCWVHRNNLLAPTAKFDGVGMVKASYEGYPAEWSDAMLMDTSR